MGFWPFLDIPSVHWLVLFNLLSEVMLTTNVIMIRCNYSLQVGTQHSKAGEARRETASAIHQMEM